MKHYEYRNGITFSFLHTRWIARISGVVLLAYSFTFCGCLSRPPLNKQTFAFGTPVLLTTNGPASHRVLGIKSLHIAPPFDGRSFVYRTGEFSYERDPYAGFLGLPAEQLAAPVSEILRGNGCFGDVVGAGSAVQPDTLVEISITQLYGDIRKPKSPFAVLAMQVTFMEATNGLPGLVILQRNFSRRIPMTSTAPAALMEGWSRALVGILTEVASDFRRKAIAKQRREDRGGNLSQK
jgi:cholesterol transport system auxiliary component